MYFYRKCKVHRRNLKIDFKIKAYSFNKKSHREFVMVILKENYLRKWIYRLENMDNRYKYLILSIYNSYFLGDLLCMDYKGYLFSSSCFEILSPSVIFSYIFV